MSMFEPTKAATSASRVAGAGAGPARKDQTSAGDEAGAHRLLRAPHHLGDGLGPVPVAGDAEDGLGAAVVLGGVPPVGLGGRVVAVAGPGPGHRGDVGLGVVGPAQEEQLHQLPGEVLVRAAGHVRLVVEVQQHGRVDGHRLGQLVQVAEGQAAVGLDLLEDEPRVHLVDAAGEQAVPEQRHLLDDGRRRRRHPVHPVLHAGDPRRVPLVDAVVDLRGDGVGRRRGGVEHPVDHRIPRRQGEEGLHRRCRRAEAGPSQQVPDIRAGEVHPDRSTTERGA